MDFLTGPEGDLAQRLKDAGSQRPHVFRDGLPAWSRACHPTSSEVP